MEANNTVLDFRTNVPGLCLKGAIAGLNGNCERELLSAQNLQGIYSIIDRLLDQSCYSVVHSGVDAFEVYTFDIDAAINGLRRLFEGHLHVRTCPPLESKASKDRRIVAASKGQRCNDVPLSKVNPGNYAAAFRHQHDSIV